MNTTSEIEYHKLVMPQAVIDAIEIISYDVMETYAAEVGYDMDNGCYVIPDEELSCQALQRRRLHRFELARLVDRWYDADHPDDVHPDEGYMPVGAVSTDENPTYCELLKSVTSTTLELRRTRDHDMKVDSEIKWSHSLRAK